MKKISVLLIVFTALLLAQGIAFAVPIEQYLCELGVAFYRKGDLENALSEFKKVLLINPQNQTAQNYINTIFQVEKPAPVKKTQARQSALLAQKAPEKPLSRDEVIEQSFSRLQKDSFFEKGITGDDEKIRLAGLKISGEAQAAAGWAPGSFIWKRANFDLNERNWRMLSDAAYNQRFNTYDPRIFDRLDVDLDTDNKESGFNLHGNIVVDPWSFTGRAAKTTVTSAFGDTAEVELKYWSNTGYTVNETVYTKTLGNTFNLPESKVLNEKVQSFSVNGGFTPTDTFSFPEMKIYREFQPIREFWVDYAEGPLKTRLFPIGFQDQAFTSDDPLAITNHHIWWEDSMWIRSYKPGIYNGGVAPVVDFTKGYWDNSLNYLSRDSNGMYLTALRGFSFSILPEEEDSQTSWHTTVGSPKTLWQEYGKPDNVAVANRLKHYFADNLLLGFTYAGRAGLNLEQGSKADHKNYVAGADIGYEVTDGIKASAEMVGSQTYYDMTDTGFRTQARGNAYYFSLVGRFPRQSIMDLKYGYDEIKMDKKCEDFLLKFKVSAARMDEGFNSDLSTYRNTRQDTFWGRHISFRRPFDYYYSGLKYPGLLWDEINTTKIGDGIDIGRNVLGLRVEGFYKDSLENLFDLRNVHAVSGKQIETVARDEITLKLFEKLTIKGMGIYHRLPKTRAGVDPFIFDAQTGEFLRDFSANPVDDGLNPSLKTGSFGLEYAFFDWISLNGVWEYTNDCTLAYGNFPRSVLNSSILANINYEYDRRYRSQLPDLYNQQFFPQPPYDFFNVFKSGLRLGLIEKKLDIYLDYTRNPFEMAAQNSDNMNHMGIEISYMPTEKLGFLLKYNYSRWKDLQRLVDGYTDLIGHHNFYGEIRYLVSKDDEFTLQYGEGNTSAIGNITFDPYGGALSSIDTRHIVRAYYRKRF